MNTYFLYGLSHKTAPIKIRELFCKKNILLKNENIINNIELIPIFTCNRVEYYFYGNYDIVNKFFSTILTYLGIKFDFIKPYLYIKKSNDVIIHLFKVVSSLDSMVIGENQILHQVKESYKLAIKNKYVGKYLHLLFQKALYIGKKVRSKTNISSSSISVATAVFDLSNSIGLSISDSSVLLIGAGEMANIIAKELYKQNAKNLFFANRTAQKAYELAQKFKANTINFNDLPNYLHKFDIIITSTGSNDYLITSEFVKNALSKRDNKPLFIIDISLPRNCDPACANIKNVYLYDLDTLSNYMQNKIFVNQSDIQKAIIIIQEEFFKFIQTLALHKNIQLFQNISISAEQIKNSYISSLSKRFTKKLANTLKISSASDIKSLSHNANINKLLENLANKVLSKCLDITYKNLKNFISTDSFTQMKFYFYNDSNYKNISDNYDSSFSNSHKNNENNTILENHFFDI